MPTFSQCLLALGLGLVTFAAAAAGDFVEAYLTRATVELKPHRVARLSVAMYAIGCVGWFTTIKVSLWFMLPEVAGLYLGSWLAITRQRACLRREAWQAEHSHGAPQATEAEAPAGRVPALQSPQGRAGRPARSRAGAEAAVVRRHVRPGRPELAESRF